MTARDAVAREHSLEDAVNTLEFYVLYIGIFLFGILDAALEWPLAPRPRVRLAIVIAALGLMLVSFSLVAREPVMDPAAIQPLSEVYPVWFVWLLYASVALGFLSVLFRLGSRLGAHPHRATPRG